MNPDAAVQEAVLGVGLHRGVPMAKYQELDALGSSRIEYLGISPLHYKHRLTTPEKATDATSLGTAVHMAVLEPALFASTYADEPDLALIGGAKPRATKAYAEAVNEIESVGRIVLKGDVMEKVVAMAASVNAHPHAAAILKRCQEREVTALWNLNGRVCRGRIDALGDLAMADIKTTRKLRDFSPWTVTRMGYYRQQGFYREGLRKLGREINHVFLVAVENVAPYDVGVWTLDGTTLEIGFQECTRLVAKLGECERVGRWPGMYPDMQQAQLTDAIALQLPELEEGDE